MPASPKLRSTATVTLASGEGQLLAETMVSPDPRSGIELREDGLWCRRPSTVAVALRRLYEKPLPGIKAEGWTVLDWHRVDAGDEGMVDGTDVVLPASGWYVLTAGLTGDATNLGPYEATPPNEVLPGSYRVRVVATSAEGPPQTIAYGDGHNWGAGGTIPATSCTFEGPLLAGDRLRCEFASFPWGVGQAHMAVVCLWQN